MQISLATLLKIQPPGEPAPAEIRYHNYAGRSTVTFNSQTYNYAGFSIPALPSADLQLTTTDTSIIIAKSSVLDDLMRQHNDFKRSVVVAYFIRMDGSGMRPAGFRLRISHATREGAAILFTARSVTSALQGKAVSKDFNVQDFPETNIYKPQL